ncbi:MAG: hypothetical protein J6K26_09455 [Lachnospiraceae bacterium]|nr:hypothetical protein [Lachnospiraceae bacterium]
MGEFILQIIQEENERLASILGEGTVGMMPVTVFLLEKYVEALKSSEDFNHNIYRMLSAVIDTKVYSGSCKDGKDPEEVKRMLQVRAMMDEMERERRDK